MTGMAREARACTSGLQKPPIDSTPMRFHHLSLALLLAACGDDGTGAGGGSGGNPDAGGAGTGGANTGGANTGGEGGEEPFTEGENTCPSFDNAPGRVKVLAWPAASNTGHTIHPGETLRFEWSGMHGVQQVADWDGTPVDPSLGRRIDSGAPTEGGSFAWNVGTFPCGYRPGLYYFADSAGGGGVTAVSLTEPELEQEHFDPKPCSTLSSPDVYGGRYAAYADRPGCTFYEVNNFQTEAHYDWVDPTFAARQGDLVLFRWTGYHSAVQVHDVLEDTLVGPGAITSGEKRNCVGGPNYLCANGSSQLGEHLIDTAQWRPGMIHMSDECAYNHPGCPSATGPESPTGVNMQFLLRAPEAPFEHPEGSCCAIDSSKGQACRVVDFYNDRDGFQYEYNVGVNRGDIVRLRYSGRARIVQVEAQPGGDDPSDTPLPGGLTSPEVDCVPGPNDSCIGADTAEAEVILDVDAAIQNGLVHESNGETFFLFRVSGENVDGGSSADANIRLYLAQDGAYDPNPACP